MAAGDLLKDDRGIVDMKPTVAHLSFEERARRIVRKTGDDLKVVFESWGPYCVSISSSSHRGLGRTLIDALEAVEKSVFGDDYLSKGAE
jgi:hypothetical protein